MKHLIILFFALTFSITAKAQEKKTVYYYVTATAYINGEGKKLIVTDVKSTKKDCVGYSEIAIKNQFYDHKKVEYDKWSRYTEIVWTYDSREKAEIERRERIGEYKRVGYTITKDYDFTYYCD